MRKAGALALLLLLPLLASAQRGGEPELLPDFAPVRRRAPSEPDESPRYEILPPRKEEVMPYDLMRKPRPRELGAKAERRELLTGRVRYWFFDGGADARYSIQVPPDQVYPPGTEVWLGETEEFGAGGGMMILAVELAPLSWLSLEAEYGRDKAATGAYRDRYWIHSPDSSSLFYAGTGAEWNNPDHEDDLVYSGDAAGDLDWSAANLYFRVLEARIAGQDDDSFRHALDLGVGAHRLRLRQRVTNLAIARSDGRFYGPFPLVPIPGYDSTYHAQWRGAHLALRDVVKFPKSFFLEGEAFWAPVGMEFRGDGYNNLSAGLRSETPNYEDRARGAAIHFRLAAGWSWGPLSLEGGYQRLYFYSRTGRRTYHNDDGTKDEYQLDTATAEFSGLFLGGAIHF